MEYDKAVESLKERLLPFLEGMGAEIIELSLKREGQRLVLRLLADKKEAITIDECALINHRIGDIIEEDQLIAERYFIEVSSPGLDRPLKSKRDFEKVKARKVDISLSNAVAGKAFIVGRVKEVADEKVVIEDAGGQEIPIPYSAIQKAKLKIEF